MKETQVQKTPTRNHRPWKVMVPTSGISLTEDLEAFWI